MQPTHEELADALSSGPCVVLGLRRRDAVRCWAAAVYGDAFTPTAAPAVVASASLSLGHSSSSSSSSSSGLPSSGSSSSSPKGAGFGLLGGLQAVLGETVAWASRPSRPAAETTLGETTLGETTGSDAPPADRATFDDPGVLAPQDHASVEPFLSATLRGVDVASLLTAPGVRESERDDADRAADTSGGGGGGGGGAPLNDALVGPQAASSRRCERNAPSPSPSGTSDIGAEQSPASDTRDPDTRVRRLALADPCRVGSSALTVGPSSTVRSSVSSSLCGLLVETSCVVVSLAVLRVSPPSGLIDAALRAGFRVVRRASWRGVARRRCGDAARRRGGEVVRRRGGEVVRR